jgi:hypothetical protein
MSTFEHKWGYYGSVREYVSKGLYFELVLGWLPYFEKKRGLRDRLTVCVFPINVLGAL